MIIPPDELYSERDYLAPTVYILKNVNVGAWNYYATFGAAWLKWLYLTGRTGGQNRTPDGSIDFVRNSPAAQTMGINVDFYTLQNGIWTITSYKYLKTVSGLPDIIFRFYKTDGSGEYWAIFDWRYMGMSATPTDSVSADKLAALDGFYRQAQLLKYRYNNLVGFLNALSKRQLTPAEQQIFNAGLLLQNNMQNEIRTIQGIELTFTQTGAIGNPILLIILIIAILAAVTGWTVYEILVEKEKTQRINDAYNLTKWVADKKQEIAQQVNAGTLSPAQANDINKTLDGATELANKIAEKSTATKNTLFDNIATVAKWGVIGFIAVKGFQHLDKKQTSNA